ncbi:MAG TPA: tyrosine-type recombinase/integrase [Pyrinomonadaceae bacterium]
MQLNQACTKFVSGYFSTNERTKKTKAAYRSDLTQFYVFAGEELLLKSVSGALIERWCAHLHQRGYSPTSIRRKMVVLKVFCSYWVRKGSLRESPFWRVKLSYGRVEQLPRALSAREMRKLLSQAKRNNSSTTAFLNNEGAARLDSFRASSPEYRSLRNLALVDLLFATGLRVGEVSSLDVQDFFMRESVFRVKGKGGRDRLAVVVDEETVRLQREYLEVRTRIETRSPALFLNSSGQRLTTQGIANVIAQLREEAGIERHVTPHMLRHTVATLLLHNGVDIRIVQEFLGHASIATTQRYTHVTKEHLRGVLRKRHPSLGMRTKK